MKRGSLTSTILGLMLTLILLSSGLATFAIINLSYSLGDARAINASGSLRMQSYRLMFYANSGSEEALQKIREFENTLYSDALVRSMDWSSPARLGQQYQLVISKWKVMKYYIEQEDSRNYASSLKDFVDTIDLLVLEMEHHAAFKLRLLAVSQIVGLGLMLLIAFIAVRFTKRKVVVPLQQMMESANTISKGNFAVEMPKTEYIELSALSDALDSTAQELATLYGNLETQVKEKTLALTRANRELKFLYDNLVLLHSGKLNFEVMRQSLLQLKEYEHLQHLRLIIQQDEDAMEVIATDEEIWPQSGQTMQFPLKFEQQELGFLEVIGKHDINVPLFENFAIMLARSIVIHNASEQRQQLALLEERAVIARELHDSLGQLLSFLKIQISLLRKGLDQSCKSPAVTQQLEELNEGVTTAYAQLRELLSTFRLTVKEPNLRNALEAMLEQLRSQTETELELNYRLPPQLLAAHQHIHILQLTREATLNAIKHANASRICISCEKNSDNMVVISIEDNGIGLAHIKERDQHFGIGIMHERASRLSGMVEFSSNASGGTSVVLTFPPQQEPHHG
ncbi:MULTISPECIES: nitrate/nitrite two-component system sensor histidine kinase NarQ [Shewanella]|jgi:two-component system nitrate/nitrite sensor histidine kinase NarQ|uniref:Sensor protein n=1 Tax=Shewanella chilikensis TaxID=558541 RepID=A0ABX5PRQ6_9GAMM|nr:MULTISPECIES: nitrate/nitrite two-component system sensor histidine kinase NarQ [Shewanella]MBZ4678885.1 two-component system sensor histidine kinase NarQ [Shewanella sp.]MCA0951490.1 nitrate/nitrite two-component system sensor histidine kinase NarQ [Shewanella chilikensis]MCE9853308.1 nitrate/nitrite two-component system sensor histidine kinase NarQ [Shewanella chilikensis]MCL1153238.1 nitrate/nitrite two-component system sensor histidine kinase NarQ [Shewanella chilikensis]MCL1164386.1 ni